jgi:hypothetical protein
MAERKLLIFSLASAISPTNWPIFATLKRPTRAFCACRNWLLIDAIPARAAEKLTPCACRNFRFRPPSGARRKPPRRCRPA